MGCKIISSNQKLARVVTQYVGLASLTLSAFGQVVAPGNFAASEGDAGGDGFLVFGNVDGFGATTQVLIEQSALNLSVGSQITGLSFRLNGGGSGPRPPSTASFANFDIQVGQAATTAETMSQTFAANFASFTLVRSGSLNLPASSFSQGATPNSFGPEITFTTPFTYAGGDLVFQFRSSGSTPAI